MKKILITNIFGIGDVLFTTPMIRNLKADFPNAEIGYLCNRRTESVLRNNTRINKVFVYERDEFISFYKNSKLDYFKKLIALVGDIKKENYDIVFDMSLNRFTGLVSLLAGIKLRVGYNYKNRGIFLNKKLELKGYEDKHVIEYYLDLLNFVGVSTRIKDMQMIVNKEDMDWAKNFLSNQGIDTQKPVIVVTPGGGASWGQDARYKRWSAQNYAKLADKIVEKYSAKIILCGDKAEASLCSEVSEFMTHHPHTACGVTTISQFAALANICSLNIVNDGGPLHIAVAAGAKTVSIFGPVDENVYGPYPQKDHAVAVDNVVCRPCYRRFRRAQCEHISCLNNITVEDVLKKVEQVLM